jgi:hypothetical protein
MTVEQQLLQFLNLSSDPTARFPPSVGIQYQVTCQANRDFRLMTSQVKVARAAPITRGVGVSWSAISSESYTSVSSPDLHIGDPGEWRRLCEMLVTCLR